MIKLSSYCDFLNETFAQHFKKNKWVNLKKSDLLTKYPELPEEFFQLIDNAYKEIGGYLSIKSAEDFMNDYDLQYIEAIDLDNDDECDLIIFGKYTPFGIKLTGVGHDDSKESKKTYIQKQLDSLSKKGHYIEVSEKLAEILLNKGVHVVEDAEVVREVLSGKNIEWLGKLKGKKGEGWYKRNIGGKEIEKIMVGYPDV